MSTWDQARGAGRAMAHRLGGHISQPLRRTLELNAFGLRYVPMILYCQPRMVRLDDEACEVMIPLAWRTRNHLGSMYFGALAVGADVAGGFLARHHIERSRRKIDLIFKTFSAEFLRRPTGDVVTRCEEGARVAAMVQKCCATGARAEETVALTASVPSEQPTQAVARFTLQISVKPRSDG